MGVDESSRDVELKRRRFQQLAETWRRDARRRDVAELERERAELAPGALDLTRRFLAGEIDAPTFRDGVGTWSRGKPVFGFGGPAGAMFLNQLVNDGEEAGVEEVLRRVLHVPSDLEAGIDRVGELVAFVEQLRVQGSAAQVARPPFFLTWFWALQDSRWQPIWPSAERALERLGWVPKWRDYQGDRVADFVGTLGELDEDPREVVEVLSWYGGTSPPVGFDVTLPERCRLTLSLRRDPPNESTAPEEAAEYEAAAQGVRVGLAEMSRIGKLFADDVAAALGEAVAVNTPTEYWVPTDRRVRGDFWVSWRPKSGRPAPGVRLHVVENGVFLVVNPEINRNPKGYSLAALARLREIEGNYAVFFSHEIGPRRATFETVTPDDSPNTFNYGYGLDVDELATPEGLVHALRRTLEHLAPAVRDLADLDAGSTAAMPETADLAALAGRFVSDFGYPRDKDEEQQASRREWASQLAPSRLAGLSKETFRKIIAQRYGGPGPQSALNTTVRDADAEEWDRLLASIDTLLWGPGPLAERIDRVLDEDDLGFRGLKETVVMKLLAITQPERFLPVFPFSGDKGKAAMLQRLRLPIPSLQGSPGSRQIAANDSLREKTEPLFPGDPWGQMLFLYWVLEERASVASTAPMAEPEGVSGVEERLAEAAGTLFVDPGFLTDIHQLLEDKGQVIFYGPPGTGKTFFAQEVAEAVAPDEDRRMLIQFHPTTTYEDFFEGYRPQPEKNGGLSYRLTPGPLRLMADAASQDPEHVYVLIVDEINRANLPKVFGELLFLLEYRNRSARLLYQPDVDFSFPENLWLIGTMNTADRSIALVDAALRRRFHFVPFIPDVAGRSPISTVLRRWVEQNGELETLPDIVDKVNNQLRAALGGDHLLLGPSYFMQRGIDENKLRRIWEYQIEPLIEDLFFGEPLRSEAFRFDRVWSELGLPAIEASSGVEAPGDAAGTAGA
jgi:5-methylcytosine-specific restriction protein B